MKNVSFEVIDKNGNKSICTVIATYQDDNTSKKFIIYTDGTFSENKELNLFYSLYEEVNNQIKLIDINNNEDKKIALELLKEVLTTIK